MPSRARPAEPDGSRRGDPASTRAALARAGLRLEALLHTGPVFDVWRACAPSGRVVAVKTPAAGSAAAAVAWLRREHRLLARLAHPHIVRALDLVEGDGSAALIMEYLGRGDLVSLAGAEPRHWLPAAADIAAALRHVHAAGFVHGDVKARNVLFGATAAGEPAGRAAEPGDRAGGGVEPNPRTGGEHAKLADFGSAAPLGAPRGAAGGTRAHRPVRFALRRAAPEEDVYAFAVLLYELLAGRLPYGRDPPDAAAARAPAWRPPGGAASRRRPPAALDALARRIAATLTACGPAGVGTLSEFSDVIESVLAGLDRRGDGERRGNS